MALVHGGQLQQIAKNSAIPLSQWLDLSTGINPNSYPIPVIPQDIWQQLPQTNQELLTVARHYYGTEHILATSGSQSVISKLPLLYQDHIQSQAQVWLPKVGYKEHEKSWQEHGAKINHYHNLPTSEQLTPYAVVVVINPNNPSGQVCSQQQLLTLLNDIERLKGWLIIDEAFIDVMQANLSMIAYTDHPNLFVLRSVGKFFGLAGIRLGFLSATPKWLTLFNLACSPWEVNGPGQFVAQYALADTQWQQQQQRQLAQQAQNLEALLLQYFNGPITGTHLFKTLYMADATQYFTQLCQQGIYVRLCDEKNALRFGIPNKQGLLKLEKTFKYLSNKVYETKAKQKLNKS